MGTVKYIAGSEFAHDRKAIRAKVEQIAPFLGALTESTAHVAREIYAIIVINEDTDRSVIVDFSDDYDDAFKEAHLCFSAMHALEVGFNWKLRIDRILLRAE